MNVMFLPSIQQKKEESKPATTHPPSGPRMNVVSAGLFITPILLGVLLTVAMLNPFPAIIGALLGGIAAMSPRVAKQWERAVVLRLGRYVGLRGPGLFWVLPLIDSV